MARVSNRFRVVTVATTANNGKKVTLAPVYTGDPEYTTGVSLYDNSERNLEIYVPSHSSNINTFVVGAYYYIDLTAA